VSPVFAQGGAIPDYRLHPEDETTLPGQSGKVKPQGGHEPASKNTPEPHGSAPAGEISAETPTREGPTEEPGSESSQAGAAPGGPRSGGNGPAGGGGKADRGGSEGHAPESAIGPAEAVSPRRVPVVDRSPAGLAPVSDDGGSSPVLPIVVAVVVLAALSVGVVLRRGRTGDDRNVPPSGRFGS
jgi:hypothetical protein